LASPTEFLALPTLVIIDDDLVSALCLEALLRGEGWRILRAEDGPSGRELAARERPDLILLDVNMPGESGLETCRRLKAMPATAAIPVIFLTGSEDLSTKLEGFRVGAVDYVTKPYEGAEVIARIQVHLQARRAMALLTASRMDQLQRLGEAQLAILPDPDSLPEARYAVHYRPFHTAGGDFYDVHSPGEGIHDYVVADVSGHEADSSLVTAALKVLLHQGWSTLSPPRDILAMVNTALIATFRRRYFLSLVWLRVNRHRRTFTLFLAGHPPPIHCDRAGLCTIQRGAVGDLLGLFEAPQLDEMTGPLAPGDRYFLFTDGLLELVRPGVDQISLEEGLERLSGALAARSTLDLGGQMNGAVHHLLGEAESIQDDLLVLGVDL